jgi:hypothetical protein
MAHKFNGVDVRTPTSFSVGFEETETSESGTTMDGLDHSDILSDKAVLSYTWSDPSKAETAQILTLIKQSRYVSITYPDPYTGNLRTAEFKPQQRSVPFRDLRVGAVVYSSLSLGFKER